MSIYQYDLRWRYIESLAQVLHTDPTDHVGGPRTIDSAYCDELRELVDRLESSEITPAHFELAVLLSNPKPLIRQLPNA